MSSSRAFRNTLRKRAIRKRDLVVVFVFVSSVPSRSNQNKCQHNARPVLDAPRAFSTVVCHGCTNDRAGSLPFSSFFVPALIVATANSTRQHHRR